MIVFPTTIEDAATGKRDAEIRAGGTDLQERRARSGVRAAPFVDPARDGLGVAAEVGRELRALFGFPLAVRGYLVRDERRDERNHHDAAVPRQLRQNLVGHVAGMVRHGPSRRVREDHRRRGHAQRVSVKVLTPRR